MERVGFFTCSLFGLRMQLLFTLFAALSASCAAAARTMPFGLQRDMLKPEVLEKHRLCFGKHLFPINALFNAQMRHDRTVSGSKRPDVQIVHATHTRNAYKRQMRLNASPTS